MQNSIDEFEFRMNEFSELLKQDLFTKDGNQKLQNDCKYFANLFADLLRENYKLKDQIIEHLRQISVYREELQKITFDVNQTTNEDRKFSKDMASIELLVKYLVEDQRYFYVEKEKMLNAMKLKEEEFLKLKELHLLEIKDIEQQYQNQKNKWKNRFRQQVQDGQDNIQQIRLLEEKILQLNQEIELHQQNIQSYESEITRKDLKIQYYQKLEQEFQCKQTDIDIKHDFAMKELQKKYRNEMKEQKIQYANNQKQLQNNYEDKFQILQKNAEVYQVQLEQKTNEFLKLSSEYDALIQLYKESKEKYTLVVQDLENQIEISKNQIIQLTEQYSKLKEDHEITKAQLKSSKDEIIRQANEIQSQQKEIKSLQLNVQNLENRMKEKVERFQRLQEQMKVDHNKQIQKIKEEMEMQSDNRMNQLQKNAQEQFEFLNRQKNAEIGKLKVQLDSSISKFEQYELIHKDHIAKLDLQAQSKQMEFNEKLNKLKEEQQVKELTIKNKDIEIQQLQVQVQAQVNDFKIQVKQIETKFQEEIILLRDGVEILIKSAKKPLEDKILNLTASCEQKQYQLANLQNQLNQLQSKYIDSEQKSHERITQLQDEMNMSINVFNKMNDNLTQKLQKMMEQTTQIQQHYSVLSEQIQTRNNEIISLKCEMKNKELTRQQENHKHQKVVKELQIYIGNQEQELTKSKNQYIESLGITQELNNKIQNLNQQYQQEKTNLIQEIEKKQKEIIESQEEIILTKQNALQQQQILEQRLQTSQTNFEQKLKILEETQIKIEKIDQEQQTEYQSKNVQQGQDNKLLVQFNKDNDPEYQEELIELEQKYQKEKAEMIIRYEQIIEQLTQQDGSDQHQEQRKPIIQIVEKIVYKEAPKKEGPIQGLDVIVKQCQRELEEEKEKAQTERQESQAYVNQLTLKFQNILKENEKEVEDMNEQIQLLKNQIAQLKKDNNMLKQDIIEQELKYQLQIQQMKEQSDVQLNTLTETCNQEIEEYRKKYEEKYVQFEQLRRQYQERMARPDDTETIQRLLKDHQELYHLVVNAYDKVKEAGDIIRYLDLEVQNYKKVNDIFGGPQIASQPPPSLSTQKMLQRVAQIKQDLEVTQNKIQQKKSDNTLARENTNNQDERQLSHLSDYSELNSRLQLDQKLPPKRKKLPKMMTSMRSNLSDAQPSSQNQTSRVVEEKSEVPLFKFDQDDQVIVEAPVSFNAFVDQRQHGSQMSQQRQNKYTVYIEKKKKDMINISDIVQQQQVSPAESRYTRRRQEQQQQQQQQQQPKKFVPYYLRNPEVQPRYKSQKKDSSFKFN
ncbi:unnamed protein product [Paramecium sonneborni]|uniref:Uncharacterized protein n=1 Tax=Paramecium sonneborni TaxID=65129 RepID=A0A8S1MXC0_9CILI|nr:unnamed protein product [Paramecium sonneborni]